MNDLELQMHQQKFDAMLEEYKLQRSEIQTRIEFMDKNANYILLLTLGISAFIGQVYNSSGGKILIEYALLISPILMYLLSRSYLLHNAVISMKGEYLATKLVPEINKLTASNKLLFGFEKFSLDYLLVTKDNTFKEKMLKRLNKSLINSWVIFPPIIILLIYLIIFVDFHASWNPYKITIIAVDLLFIANLGFTIYHNQTKLKHYINGANNI